MSVATVYAKALVQAAAATDVLSVERELHEFHSVLCREEGLRVALTGPVTASSEKARVTKALIEKMKPSAMTGNFLLLLAKKGRMGILPEILTAVELIRLDTQGVMLGAVVSADPLAQQEVEELQKAFGKKLGKSVHLKATVDSTLLAGVKVTVGGVTYDGTLGNQLQKLKDKFVQGNI